MPCFVILLCSYRRRKFCCFLLIRTLLVRFLPVRLLQFATLRLSHTLIGSGVLGSGLVGSAENFDPPLFYSRPLRTVLYFAGPEVDLRYCSSAWSEDSEYMLFTLGDPLERKFVLKSRPVVVVVGEEAHFGITNLRRLPVHKRITTYASPTFRCMILLYADPLLSVFWSACWIL